MPELQCRASAGLFLHFSVSSSFPDGRVSQTSHQQIIVGLMITMVNQYSDELSQKYTKRQNRAESPEIDSVYI